MAAAKSSSWASKSRLGGGGGGGLNGGGKRLRRAASTRRTKTATMTARPSDSMARWSKISRKCCSRRGPQRQTPRSVSALRSAARRSSRDGAATLAAPFPFRRRETLVWSCAWRHAFEGFFARRDSTLTNISSRSASSTESSERLSWEASSMAAKAQSKNKSMSSLRSRQFRHCIFSASKYSTTLNKRRLAIFSTSSLPFASARSKTPSRS
mmetsp:Transcript_11610/g.38807  ORF Transcript_11610/g.38807 Transcript_11610/m.38807 type:complete len:211 (-) Transcript_11610:1313-1945(-)